MLKYKLLEFQIQNLKDMIQCEVEDWMEKNDKDCVYLSYKNGNVHYKEAYMEDGVLMFTFVDVDDEGCELEMTRPISEIPVEDAAQIIKILEKSF